MRATMLMAALLAAASPSALAAQDLFDVSSEEGSVRVDFPSPDEEGTLARMIYVTQFESGLGSPVLSLDRGSAGSSRLLRFRLVGDKVLAEIENSKFIASRGSPIEQDAITKSFATSVIWAGDAERRRDGGVSVDLSDFLLRDDRRIANSLTDGGAGEFSFEKGRSAIDPASIRAFPDNVEISTILTFKSSDPKIEVNNILPDTGALTMRMRHSFVRLPESGYVPRTSPYGYSFGTQVVDASAPLGQPMVRVLMNRFRLEKTDPGAERSTVREPIVFYIDAAAPDAVRQALYEGVSWWSDAFEAAGLIDAFRVEILPEGADPLDVRYNVVNWVNRATRGWSYGGVVWDPRTGEILKGYVQLGSLRVRQDIMILQALKGAGLTGTGDPEDPIDVALARIRQLGAHEVGHALGFDHNFAGSTQGRYSVLDYPAPRVTLNEDGSLSIADAYGVGIGEWDKFMVAYAYGAQDDAQGAVEVAEARRKGLRFVGDDNSRPLGAPHPDGGLWDDGENSVEELLRILAVRDVALQRYSIDALPPGASQADYRRSFVPIWLLHRYQLEATAKQVGGVRTPMALVGDAMPAEIVDGETQWEALAALLEALDAERLTVPTAILPYLSGADPVYDRQRAIELMEEAGADVFDPLGASEVAAMAVIAPLLDADRLDRLESQHAADSSIPSPLQLVDAVLEKAFQDADDNAEKRRVATIAAMAVARTARDSRLSPTIAVSLDDRVKRLGGSLVGTSLTGEAGAWARGLGSLLVNRDRLDEAVKAPGALPSLPPGSPIG